MQEPEPTNEAIIRRLLSQGLPEHDPNAEEERVDRVLHRCREQVHGRDTITLLFARLWVALATLLARLMYLSRDRPVSRIATYFAAAPPG